MLVANQIAEFMDVPANFTEELYKKHKQEIDGNAYSVAKRPTETDIKPTIEKLRKIYKPHVRQLYEFFDEFAIDFEEFKEWPRSEFGDRWGGHHTE